MKIVPEGANVSPSSPYFTTMEELNRARSSGRALSDYFGLPASNDAPQYDIYSISPKEGAFGFRSTVAPTSELNGMFVSRAGGEQVVVPNRGQFSSPQKIGSIFDN